MAGVTLFVYAASNVGLQSLVDMLTIPTFQRAPRACKDPSKRALHRTSRELVQPAYHLP